MVADAATSHGLGAAGRMKGETKNVTCVAPETIKTMTSSLMLNATFSRILQIYSEIASTTVNKLLHFLSLAATRVTLYVDGEEGIIRSAGR
jgi:hypothetical protein